MRSATEALKTVMSNAGAAMYQQSLEATPAGTSAAGDGAGRATSPPRVK